MTQQAEAVAAGLRAALEVAGVSVTFYQGDRSCDLVALRGRSSFEVISAASQVDAFESVDWICLATDLRIDDAPILPSVGAVVQLATDGGFEKYQILKPAGKDCFAMDPTRTQLRIFTKRVQ